VKKADRGKRAGARSSSQAGSGRVGSNAVQVKTLAEAMPASEPAYPILAEILGIVPVSRWSFARVAPSGAIVSVFGSHASGKGVARLTDEFRLQREKAPTGPRIAATLGSLDEYDSGITLLFADARAHFGILTLLRTAELGPFSSSEIRMLTFALDALSEHLSTLRLQPPARTAATQPAPHDTRVPPAPEEAFYILNSDLEIILAWSAEDQRRIALTGLHTRIAERLPVVLEETVRTMTSAWSGGSANASGARPVSFLVVRTQPMSGPAGLFIGVRIDRFQPPNSLTGAASRFHISPREVQVLALLLDGNHLDQIADRLSITSSTVQDHIGSMLGKTESRNRSELIARVLGWESSPDQPAAIPS
jgi:DNA-binding CsgD family transcriptional regulator